MSAAEPYEFIDAPEFGNDHCGKAGAERIKAKIEAYWRERGAMVHCRIEPKGFTAALRAARYDVRSDMIDALPRLRALPSREQE